MKIRLAEKSEAEAINHNASFMSRPTTRWWSAMAIGALYGLAFGLLIYLAKGGPKSGDAPYVIPSGIITGGLIGLFILIWAAKKI
jgi:tetrahydromethanopterin S-methyltransferase subunit E